MSVDCNLQPLMSAFHKKNGCEEHCKEVKGHLRQESLGHQVHAPDIHIHGEVPVVFRAVQNVAMVHKPEHG